MASTRIPLDIKAVFDSLDDPEKLLTAVLDHAVLRAGAARGMIFDRHRMYRAVNYSHNSKIEAWRALETLQFESNGIAYSTAPLFTARVGVERVGVENDPPAVIVGLAGVLTGPSGVLGIVAIEHETGFNADETASFAEWIDVVSKPVAVSLSNERLGRMVNRRPLRLRDLPLAELEVLPNVQEIEMILIEAAMKRHNNHRGLAAKAIGISREGLRRKLARSSS